MKVIESQQKIKVPDYIKEVKVTGRKVSITGKRGTLVKNFSHNNLEIEYNKSQSQIIIRKWFGKRKELAVVRTICSHIENMFKGTTYGYLYKMRAVYAHFPINMNIVDGGKMVEVRNFLGEKSTRFVKMLPGCTIAKTGVKDEFSISGNDLELVSGSAALLHQSVLVKKKDIRMFLDGIYVSLKTTIDPIE